jgi:hypothetical protein
MWSTVEVNVPDDKTIKARWHRKSSQLELIRWPTLLQIIPLGETKIRKDLIATGRLTVVPFGPKSVGFIKQQAEAIRAEYIAAAMEAAS